MRRFIIGILAFIGTLTLALGFLFFWSLHRMGSPSLPSLTPEASLVLSLTLGDESLAEQPSHRGIRGLIENASLSVYEVIEGINHAAHDPLVKGLLLTLEGKALKLATTQEIREALKAFKATGKFIYTYTDSFGALSNGTMNYYLAAVSTQIWMLPLGTLNFIGLMTEIPFARKALDDLKISPQLGRREEYKGFLESITEADFTQPYRENMQRIIDAFATQIVTDVAADRNLPIAEVRKMLDTGPHAPNAAVTTRMIDQVGYKDQVKDAIKDLLGQKPTYHPFEAYASSLTHRSKGEKIAIIYAVGGIAKGRALRNPLGEEATMDALEIAQTIREAGEDTTIKAIILRIESGGGDPIATSLIGREVERLKTKKPLIVSMANYAASGGYWIACAARKILAHPGTLTGSIGFYAGKIVTQGFWEQLGVYWGEIHSGDNAAIWSSGQDYTEAGKQKFNDYLDQVYDIFQETVSRGRNLSREAVHKIAKGQVWTGAEAKGNGLVDELGGLTAAIALAKKEIGLATGDPFTLVHLPAARSFLDFIFDSRQDYVSQIFARHPSLQVLLKQLDGILAPPHMAMKIPSLDSK